MITKILSVDTGILLSVLDSPRAGRSLVTPPHPDRGLVENIRGSGLDLCLVVGFRLRSRERRARGLVLK